MQLDLFENKSLSEIEMQMEIFELKESQNKLRRGFFKRYDELKNTVVDLQMKIDEISKKDNKAIWLN
jgi:FtsZ-binding cell division protein ZapB